MNAGKIAVAVVLGCLFTPSTLQAQPVLDRVEQLLRRQLEGPRGAAAEREPGYLGLVADDRGEQGRGVRVLSVAPGGPAANAGVEQGDLITAVDGRPVRSMDDIVAAMASRGPGSTVTMTTDRDGATAERKATVGRRPATGEPLPSPATPGGPKLGMRTLEVTDQVARENKLPDQSGAVVIAIAPGSRADRAGIPLGAVIRTLDGAPVRNPQELAAAVAAAKGSIELVYVFAAIETKVRINLGEDGPSDVRRPIQPPAPSAGADELPPPAIENERINKLEAKVRALEERVEKLEAAAKTAAEK